MTCLQQKLIIITKEINKMTRIIELAHALGEEIAKSDEIKNLEAAKDAFEKDAELQAKMSEYEADRMLLGGRSLRRGFFISASV